MSDPETYQFPSPSADSQIGPQAPRSQTPTLPQPLQVSPSSPTPRSSHHPRHAFLNNILESTNPPLRHLASHTSLSTIRSNQSQESGTSHGRRSRSRSRSRSQSRGRQGAADPGRRVQRQSFVPMATNFEEQRHPGKPTLFISRNTRIYEPESSGMGRSNSLSSQAILKNDEGELGQDGIGRLSSMRSSKSKRASGGASNAWNEGKLGQEGIGRLSSMRSSKSKRASGGASSAWNEGGPSKRNSKNSTLGSELRPNSMGNRELDRIESATQTALNPIVPFAVEEAEEEEVKYPAPLPLFILILGICLSVFLISLDRTIITTVCPSSHKHTTSKTNRPRPSHTSPKNSSPMQT